MEMSWEVLKCKRCGLTTRLRVLGLPQPLWTLMRSPLGGQLSWFSKENSTKASAWFILFLRQLRFNAQQKTIVGAKLMGNKARVAPRKSTE